MYFIEIKQPIEPLCGNQRTTFWHAISSNWHAVRGMIVLRKQKSAFKNKSRYMTGLIIKAWRRTWIHLYNQWSKSSTFLIITFYTVANSFSLLYNITEWNVLVFISYQNTLYFVKRTAINLFINTERLHFCESTIFLATFSTPIESIVLWYKYVHLHVHVQYFTFDVILLNGKIKKNDYNSYILTCRRSSIRSPPNNQKKPIHLVSKTYQPVRLCCSCILML